MIFTTQVQEDSILSAQFICPEDVRIGEDKSVIGKWRVQLADTFSGKRAEVIWTQQEFAAVQFLVYNGDEANGPNNIAWPNIISIMYRVAEPLFTNLPPEVRCIP